MTASDVTTLGQSALVHALLVGAPVLGISLAMGLVVSLFQATTQINEQTLVYVPKILAVVVALIIFGPWMLTVLVDYARHLFIQLPSWVR